MEVVNNNEIIRDNIVKIFKDKKYLTVDSFYDDIDALYDNLFNYKDLFKLCINAMYIPSYIINYTTYLNNISDEDIKCNIELLESLDLDNIDKEDFRFLLCDTVLYNSLDYYEKKSYFDSFIYENNFLLKKVPIFLNDIIYFGSGFTVNDIMNYYQDILESIKDEDLAKEKTIEYASSLLYNLSNQNKENYSVIINDIISIYYEFNKYKIDNNYEIDSINLDIIKFIENDPKDFKSTLLKDNNILFNVLNDFICYSTLDNDEIIKVRKHSISKENNNYVFNINNKIRKELNDTFGYINIPDEDEIDIYKEALDALKNSKYIDEIIKVLYIDNFSSVCFEYASFPNDIDVKLDYDYLKGINTIEEYKRDLLENDLVFLTSINYSNYFYESSFIEKKELIKTLTDSNMYDNFIIKNYIFDVINFNREYTLNDADEIYSDLYLEFGDRKIAIANSLSYLISDLITLEVIDNKNYNNVIYDILKKFYMYNKYLLDNNMKIDDEVVNILSLIENDTNNFFDEYEINAELQEKIYFSYYEYVSSNVINKKQIDLYYKENDRGISKIFNRKK